LRLVAGHGHFANMATRRAFLQGFVEPCIPTLAAKPPSGPGWVHEIKHDGYRLIVRRDGDAVRLFTGRGFDWTDRYPAIATAAAKLRASSFTLDGEAVVCGPWRRRVRRAPPPAQGQRRDDVRLRPAGAGRCRPPPAAAQ
jgi:ATP-dependent DNA ligase